MTERRYVHAILLFVLLCTLLCFLLLHKMGYPGAVSNEYPFPEEGTWHCHALGCTLYLDQGTCTFNDGKNEIQCSYLCERATGNIYIHCYEFDNPNYEFEHRFFSGDFLRIDGDVFYVKDHSSGIEYAFGRVVE